MRGLITRTLRLLVRFRVGRWMVTLLFLAIGLILVLDPTAADQDVTTTLVEGGFVLLCGLALLIFTILIEVRLRKAAAAKKASLARAEELVASGKVLAIPALPKTLPQGASADDLFTVEQYAVRMADLPWGAQPKVAAVEEAYPLFNRTVGRVRGVTGMWSELSEPIDISASLPKPLCYVGAAEIMYKLSYLRGTIWAPVGLRQGLRFIARAQYFDPEQPDALVARVNLLTGYPGEQWLKLAEETLAILKRVAPEHPRLPDAESNILVRRNRLDEAMACIEQTLAHPPTPEEEHVALSRKARNLDRMKQPEEALAAYDVVNERYPQDPWAWHNKSLLLINLNRLDDAWAANQRALSLMTFNNALKTRENILAKFAETGKTPPVVQP